MDDNKSTRVFPRLRSSFLLTSVSVRPRAIDNLLERAIRGEKTHILYFALAADDLLAWEFHVEPNSKYPAGVYVFANDKSSN